MYKQEAIPRVPIICTGNDFSTLYAPLIRDGRMEKYYWSPTREDRVGVCMGIFQHDGVSRSEVEHIVDSFPGQSIDFFGALRSRVYDDKVGCMPTRQGFVWLPTQVCCKFFSFFRILQLVVGGELLRACAPFDGGCSCDAGCRLAMCTFFLCSSFDKLTHFQHQLHGGNVSAIYLRAALSGNKIETDNSGDLQQHDCICRQAGPGTVVLIDAWQTGP